MPRLPSAGERERPPNTDPSSRTTTASSPRAAPDTTHGCTRRSLRRAPDAPIDVRYVRAASLVLDDRSDAADSVAGHTPLAAHTFECFRMVLFDIGFLK